MKTKWYRLSSLLAAFAVITVTPASVFYIYGGDAPEELLK
ncbi:cyclic lactone autoinducer peptide [Paenibacillus sp. LMG 31459]|uniref:Cyclic lactone autoinducer peptide n=1 Tax=Paenibacillus phytohabitans TaxID=2654978 RepID=A0ABX1YLE1_9BACL|nr:cyclic lactone autoinducer peptide [Paenibacillus phytohabitans]NOU80600.1 cyclic lactone autoinducer peptide [Paenibacillus phytohabitans]